MYIFKQLRLLLILLILPIGQVEAMLPTEQQSLAIVLKEIEHKYQIVFSYNSKDVKNITIDFRLKPAEKLEAAINRALLNTGLKYKFLGLNFYVLYKDTTPSKRKLKKIKRKIRQIKRLGKEDDFMLFEEQSVSKLAKSSKRIELKGKITNEIGEPLIGASIRVNGTNKGTTSNENGQYTLKLNSKELAELLEVSYTGYYTQQTPINRRQQLDVQLKQGLLLESVTVIGSRGAPRTSFDSPVPIDHLCFEVLNNQGKATLGEQLAQAIPSFNVGQHPVSDASAHINPVDLRGLLPSRTLVLMNGKRKNNSALLYTYITASRGEVGVDLKAIAPDGIQAVEVLRDGAAAQYGSDAIAGVLNLVLKDRIRPFINTGYSTTSEGDGNQFNASTGFSIDLKKSGFATFTFGYGHQQRSQRAGQITSAADEAKYWGTNAFSLEDFENYLSRNPSAGFQVGLPDSESFNLTLNAEYALNKTKKTSLYSFGNIMSRKGKSPQFARGPYWVQGFNAIYPEQDYFLPEMAPSIADQSLTIGLKHTHDDWKMDISTTFGSNRIAYYINNSFNQSLGENSPKNFYNGTHNFRQLVTNLDVHRTFHPSFLKSLNVAFGLEQRLEIFEAKAGEFASYGDGTPDVIDRVGSESFRGLSPQEELRGNRNNIGFYTELTGMVKEDFKVGLATRLEHYSDFGANLSWKLNTLYKVIPKKLNLRASISNGFRAPALHQIYYSSTTTTLTPEGIVQNRILNNLDPALAILGVPILMPEMSFNMGVGFIYKLTNKIGLSADFYKIDVKDRILLSGQIGRQGQSDSPINQLLDNTGTESAGFFLNAVNTTTCGIDLVVYFDQLKLGQGHWKSTLAANFGQTTVTDIHLPQFIEQHGLTDEVFSREDISRLETWRPNKKILTTHTYSIGKFSTTIMLNYFGAVTYKHPINPVSDATYSGKFITNWSTNYDFSSKIKLQFGIHNLFNIYPDTFTKAYQGVPADRNIDFVGRFQYPWQTIQFGIDGRRGFTKLMVSF